MSDSLEEALRKGNAWADQQVRQSALMSIVERQGLPLEEAGKIGVTINSVVRSFGAGRALESYQGLFLKDPLGIDDLSQVVAYEVATNIVRSISSLATVRLDSQRKSDERKIGSEASSMDQVFSSFMSSLEEASFEGLLRGEQRIINYITEHFYQVRSATEEKLPPYQLIRPLFSTDLPNNVTQRKEADGSARLIGGSEGGMLNSLLTFKDYVGGDSLKERMRRQLFVYVTGQDRWRRLVKDEQKIREETRLNFLFYGPSGSGKSYFCKALAGELGIPFFFLKGADFVQKYVGEGKNRLEEVYRQATAHEKKIGMIIIEEADVIGASRDVDESRYQRDVINAWLTLLQEGVPGGKVITVMNTNRRDIFDKAILDRFPVYNQLYFPPPDDEMRKKIFSHHLNRYHHEPIGDDDLTAIVSSLEGLSLRAVGDVTYLASCYAADRSHERIVKKDIFSAIDDYHKRVVDEAY